MTIEIAFILLLLVACYFSWKGGVNEGNAAGIDTGVYATLYNLESGGVIKVINYDDGGSVIMSMGFTELHVDSEGKSKTIINPFKGKQQEESICEEKK